MMDAFDEKLKDLDLPQGLKELLQLSLSDEVKERIGELPTDRLKRIILDLVNEANNGSVELFDDAFRRRIQL